MSPNPAPDLLGCALKLRRASAQFAELDGLAARFIDEVNPYRTEGEFDADGIHRVYRLTENVIQPPTDDWGPLLGEIAYNLASALDHLVCQLLIAQQGAAECDRTQFPIFEKDTYYARGQIAKYTNGLLPADRKLITDLQPYQRGNDAPRDPLWLLRRINNIDKHRRLHVVSTAVFEKTVVMWEDRPVESPDMTVNEAAAKAGDEIVRFDTTKVIYKPGNTHLALVIQITFSDPGGPLDTRSLRSVFPEIILYIHRNVFPKFEHRVGKLPELPPI